MADKTRSTPQKAAGKTFAIRGLELFVAAALAVAGWLATSYLMNDQPTSPPEERAPEQPKVTVLVARKNLDMGGKVKNPQELFVEKQFPMGDEPKNAIVAFEVLKDKYLKRSLRKEDWITPEDLADSVGRITWQLPEGYNAVDILFDIPVPRPWNCLAGSCRGTS